MDFFEHNQQLTEIEFGGNDLLQVYNGQQIKHRLNSTGMYVANTKVGILEQNDSMAKMLKNATHHKNKKSLIYIFIICCIFTDTHTYSVFSSLEDLLWKQ